jgi:alanine racemase
MGASGKSRTLPARPLESPQPLATLTASLNAWVEIHLRALAENVALLREQVAPAELIAVVKANGYGAGGTGLVRALEDLGVRRFAVAWVPEALELRAGGARGAILVLGHALESDAAAAVAADITLSCDSLALGEAVSRAAVELGRTARLHIHVDTGLHRDGVTPAEAVPLANALRGRPGLQVEGLSTHMANADETDDSFSDEQQARFREVCRSLDWIPYRHTANSATALRRPEFRFDGVRVGLALHGIAPDNSPGRGLTPILQLKARVARVLDVAPGEGASYGLTWRAQRASRLALIPVGYADGWRRALSNRGEVLINGRRCRIAGRVCMDQFLADVSEAGDVASGDEAVLIGRQGDKEISAREIAETLGTIPWEVLSGLQARLPRVFQDGGNAVGVY